MNKGLKRSRFWVISICLGLMACPAWADVQITGELKQWHAVTLLVEGPETSETATPNPFTDFRLNVTFEQEGQRYTVPGYYAADGQAGETSADSGNIWKAHFAPPTPGDWTYWVSFRQGDHVALSMHPAEGDPLELDGAHGQFTIGQSDKEGRDFRAHGFLRHEGERYLRFSGSGAYFLKGGADSPENFLAYHEFDGTYRHANADEEQREGESRTSSLHRYEPHIQDWRQGDPTWQDGKGKGIIGALNYLASEEMNSVYFLTMNVEGDGKDVWPWTAHDERFCFDCSKLDQWNLVLDHMTQKGLLLHVITQETENDQLLDGGDLGPERRLYYRELVARFAHHPALVWNLGEENTNTDDQRRAYAKLLKQLDAYDHPIVVHTYPNQYDKVYEPLLGYPYFNGPSLQMGNMKKTHDETVKWVRRSAETGRQWFVSLDEIGPANVGVKPDADDPEHNDVRHFALWGNLMGGGAGCEWYFGYQFAHNDLNCEDWRSRANMWAQTRYALQFFHRHLPFTNMHPHDQLTAREDDYCLALEGEIYAIYQPDGEAGQIELPSGTYEVHWYNPRQGGELQSGEVETLEGGDSASYGEAPGSQDRDWVVLIQKTAS